MNCFQFHYMIHYSILPTPNLLYVTQLIFFKGKAFEEFHSILQVISTEPVI